MCVCAYQYDSADISSIEMNPTQSFYLPVCRQSPSPPPSLSLCASLPCSPSYSPLYEITHSIQSISEFVECNPGNLSGSFILNQSRGLHSSIGANFSTALKSKIIHFINICCFHIMNVINNDYWPQSIGSQTCICISHYGWKRLSGLPQFKSTVITLSSGTGLLWFSITAAML